MPESILLLDPQSTLSGLILDQHIDISVSRELAEFSRHAIEC